MHMLMDQQAKQRLLKALREGKINRDVVCDTLFKADDGEQILLEVCKANRNAPQVLKSAIRAFRSLVPDDHFSELLLKEILDSSK